MRYYRCKCGNCQAWGSMPPEKCNGCKECNTTLEESPNTHTEPSEHKWITEYDKHTGEPYEICLNCLKRKDSI